MTTGRPTDPAYHELPRSLVEALPELRDSADAELETWVGMEVPPHAFYGAVLNPYLLDLLERGGPEDALRRAFDHLEMLARHRDSTVRDLVISIPLERIHASASANAVRRAEEYAGPRTREILRQMMIASRSQPTRLSGLRRRLADLVRVRNRSG